MNPEKEIVNLWLNKTGFFTINNIMAGKNKKIDIFAIKLKNGVIDKIQQVDIACSISSASTITLEKGSVEVATKKYVVRKFEDKLVVKKINEALHNLIGRKHAYEKVVVLGQMAKANRKQTINKLEQLNIKVHKFEDILYDVLTRIDKQNYNDITLRTLQLTKYLLLAEPIKLSQLLQKKHDDILNQFTREIFLKQLLKQKEVKRILDKESSEEEIIELLKYSSLKQPEKLAKVLEEQILSKRSRTKFVKALVKQKTIMEEVKKLEKKQRPLNYFFKHEQKTN